MYPYKGQIGNTGVLTPSMRIKMGQSAWTSILIAIAIYKTKGVQGDCELISPGCYGQERNSATVECSYTTDNFESTVTQEDCLGYNGYINYGENIKIYNFGSSFDISVKLSHCNFNTDPFENMRTVEIYITTITIHLGILFSVPTGLYRLDNVNSVTIVATQLEKINLNTFLGLQELKSLNVSYKAISVLEEDTEVISTVSRIITIDLSHNMIETIPDNCFGHFTQLKYLYLFHNSLTHINILTFEGLSQLYKLDLSYNKLMQIGHTFVRFVNLKELSLAHNNLETINDLNLRSMTSLEKLNISGNKLIHIDDAAFQSLYSLTELDLTDNHISFITALLFKNNSNLNSLHLSQNSINTVESGAFEGKNITSFFFEHNNLTGPLKQASFENVYSRTLDLSGGKITSLETEAFRKSHIHSLNLSSNVIDSISNTTFRSLNDLTFLDLSNNNISSINFKTTEFNDLVMLDVRNNSLKHISKNTFKNLMLLEMLDLSFNYISELQPQSFTGLETLENLDLKSNNLSNSLEANTFQGLKALPDLQLVFTKIPSFEDDAFSGLDSLRILNTSHGVLASIGYNTFNNTGSLEILDLSYNLLEDFSINTSSLPLLEELYLNNNQIRNVTNNTFLGLMNLMTLDLQNNNIVKLGPMAFCTLSNLRNLDMSSNSDAKINSDIFDNLTSLTTLSLRNNRKQISFENTSNTTMKQLDLSSCQIENANTIFIFKVHNLERLNLGVNITFIDKFTLQNMPHLFWLDLSFNLISFIQPGSFLRTCNIQVLNLHGNKIRYLQFGVLDGLKKIRELNLSNNALHSFDISILHKAPQIRTISLDDNAIEDISFYRFSDTSIKVITIGGNPISCNVFVALKKDGINGINVTAESLDYHSENVDGIRCKSDSKFNKSLVWPSVNNTDINATFTFVALKKAIENYDALIEKHADKNKDQGLSSTTNMTHILESIDKHIVTNNNNSQMIVNYLQKLSDTIMKFIHNSITSDTVPTNDNDYISQSITESSEYPPPKYTKSIDDHLREKLNEEKEIMIVELKNIFQSLKNEGNISRHYESRTEEQNTKTIDNGVLYFVAVCLTLIIIILLFLVYKFVKGSRVLYNTSLHSSRQPIANVIEMQ